MGARLNAADIEAAICATIIAISFENSRPAQSAPAAERGSFSLSRYPDHPSGRTVVQLDGRAFAPRW